jgi:hypothetical protein
LIQVANASLFTIAKVMGTRKKKELGRSPSVSALVNPLSLSLFSVMANKARF